LPDVLFRLPTGYRAKGWKSHDQVAVLQDGRVIAYGVNWVQATWTSDAGEVLNVRLPDLRMVEYVLQVQLTTDPSLTDTIEGPLEVTNKKISGNVVGMTISGDQHAAGTTLTVEVIAIGPP